MTLTPELIATIEKYNEQERLKYLLAQVNKNQEIWILVNEHGCMMLNTEDESCIPVWPNQAFAQNWITDDWKECKAEAIPLNKWKNRWIPGLEDDELSIVAFPSQEEGLVLYPDEFDFELSKQAKKEAKQ